MIYPQCGCHGAVPSQLRSCPSIPISWVLSERRDNGPVPGCCSLPRSGQTMAQLQKSDFMGPMASSFHAYYPDTIGASVGFLSNMELANSVGIGTFIDSADWVLRVASQWSVVGQALAGRSWGVKRSERGLISLAVKGLTAHVALTILKAVVMPLTDTHDLGQILSRRRMVDIKVTIFSRIGLSERNNQADHIEPITRTRLRLYLYSLSMAVIDQPRSARLWSYSL